MKKISKILTTILSITIFGMNIAPIQANDSKATACKSIDQVMQEIKEEETNNLQESNVVMRRGAILTIEVNKTVSIPIQNQSGTCADIAKARITGNYTVEDHGTSREVRDINLNTVISSVPAHWFVDLGDVTYVPVKGNVDVEIYYGCRTDDFLNCMVGGAVFWTGYTVRV